MAGSELQLAIRATSVLPKMCVALRCFSRAKRIYPCETLSPEIKRFKAVVSIGDTSQFIRVEKEYQRTLGISAGFRAWI